MANDNNNSTNSTTSTTSTTSTGDSHNMNTLINLYFRGNYIFMIGLILSILFKQTYYLYWIINIILECKYYSILILLNVLALYVILYKINLKFTFSISYN